MYRKENTELMKTRSNTSTNRFQERENAPDQLVIRSGICLWSVEWGVARVFF